MISAVIGGSTTGSATASTPSLSGFTNKSLTSVFQTGYNNTKIKNWYSYPVALTPVPKSSTLPPPIPGKSKTPAYLGPVLGVVLGLFSLTLIILVILLRRCRTVFRERSATSEAGTMDNQKWVANWLRSTPADAKALTVTTDEIHGSPHGEDDRDLPSEMGNTQVREMMDTSRPVELYDTQTGFTHLLTTCHAGMRGQSGLHSSPSVTSHASKASSVSQASGSRPTVSPIASPRGESPSLGSPSRVLSGVSNVSASDRGHFRGISEAGVSTESSTPMIEHHRKLGIAPEPQGASLARLHTMQSASSPRTPPLGVERSRDYAGAQRDSPTSSAKRKSNFSEGLDEVGKK